MSKATEIIKHYKNSVFTDEDGNITHLTLAEGTSVAEISDFEKTNGIKIPAELREVLLLSNGFDLFGVEMLSLDDMEFFPGEKMLSIHNWGNGDFDCIDVSAHNVPGAILFMYHSEENLFLVANTLGEWLETVVKELQSKGTLLHPMDYANRNENGVYTKIWFEMQKIKS